MRFAAALATVLVLALLLLRPGPLAIVLSLALLLAWPLLDRRR
ncbi:hypothetical protein [Methylobacterium sp.]|nr:hypothetical protein [Methylobacterium sp.]